MENRFKKTNWIMFLPALLFASASAIFYIIMGISDAENFVRSFYYNQDIAITKTGELQRILFFGSRITFVVQVIYFLIKGSKLVKKYNERIANFYSNIEGKNIRWVNLLLKSFVATSAMSIVFNFLGKSSFIDSGYFLIIPSAIFSTLLFIIGFEGFMQNHTVANLIDDEHEIEPIVAATPKQVSRDKLKTQLLQLFSGEEIYTNNNLKITLVSEKLNTNRTYLSNLINEEFSCTFSDFVGKFRVDKAKQILQDDIDCKYSIDYISDQVGFGSTSSFIRMFKKNEGVTPGSYRTKYKEKIEIESREATFIR
ncbi:helix-turn-helix domain-containing protein [Sunxiuqinia sp. A32]|uniref:helix-turn-helix domain-containing protein n=1 Tax=Sunxiuqinia sp. A32 TaxID=3461496 RepID=UPI00404554E8